MSDPTLTLLVALGTFVVTSAGHVLLARHYLRLGWQLCRDDQALDPGEVTGSLGAAPAVGESSGRHALPDWPPNEDTAVIPAVVLSEQDRREIQQDVDFERAADAAEGADA